MRLRNKVALITGVAVGIGRVEARLFAAEGATIVASDINESGGQETVSMVKESGGEAIFVPADVTKSADIKHLVETAIQKYGRIDIIINDAGIPQKPTQVEDIDEALWHRVHDVNVKSVFLTAKYAVPYMKKARKGVIINTSTQNSVRPQPGHAALVSAKNSVIAITKALALDLAPYNIRVNCISPWTINTPSFQASLSEAEKQQWIDMTPLGRIGTPEDIAYGALYLASDEASWVTGICLSIDGGYGI
ncbi:MAG: short-chain dehydrogenase/reductase [Acidobacteria bacterium]|jgi:3-oxoacyl-[acyl-carrier protein] reductase|nr:short-chain dehydrogenase/reductase [Acidobacteriota bacterium]